MNFQGGNDTKQDPGLCAVGRSPNVVQFLLMCEDKVFLDLMHSILSKVQKFLA